MIKYGIALREFWLSIFEILVYCACAELPWILIKWYVTNLAIQLWCFSAIEQVFLTRVSLCVKEFTNELLVLCAHFEGCAAAGCDSQVIQPCILCRKKACSLMYKQKWWINKKQSESHTRGQITVLLRHCVFQYLFLLGADEQVCRTLVSWLDH